jgi:hypothetical protein
MVLVAVLVLFLFAVALELVLRLAWPQHVRITHLNGRKLVVHDPSLGYVCNRNAHLLVKGPEFEAEYRINEDGLRDESLHREPGSSLRSLLIGDSFTFGAANHYDKIWPVIFERQMDQWGHDIEVVKAGVPFHNTDNDALYLEQIVPKYRPDVVVSVFVPNNLFVNVHVTDEGESLKRRERRKDDIIGMNNKTSQLHTATLIKRLLISNDLLYALIYMKTFRSQFFVTPSNETVRQQVEITKTLLTRMERYCRQKGILFLVLSIPQQFQVIAKARGYRFGNLDVDCIDRTFEAFAEEKGFAWLPTLPLLADAYGSDKKKCFFRLDGHLTNEGNRLVGEYFSRKLADQLAKSGPGENQSILSATKLR